MTEMLFQYPLRVEVGCNGCVAGKHMRRNDVSVPSTGRSGLQRYGFHITCKSCSRFSTLYGSKWVATFPKLDPYWCALTFQYPLRVEVGCNQTREVEDQFSLYGFSTLYGSKWVATQLNGLALHPYGVFQYPLRVEVGCNVVWFGSYMQSREFQYPLRVEVGCNINRTQRTLFAKQFQYPLRVEVGCNQ